MLPSEDRVQAPRGVTLERVEQDYRFRITGHKDDQMNVVTHHSKGREKPPAVSRRLTELLPELFRMFGCEEFGWLVEDRLGIPLQPSHIPVVLGSGLIVDRAFPMLCGMKSDKPACITGKPVPVARPGEQPRTVEHGGLRSGIAKRVPGEPCVLASRASDRTGLLLATRVMTDAARQNTHGSPRTAPACPLLPLHQILQ